jgi:hypothetical protein
MVTVSVRHHKRVQWQEEWRGKKRPGSLESIKTDLIRALHHRQGGVWALVKSSALIAGYPESRRGDVSAVQRDRSFRRDGAESLLSLVVALLSTVDIRTGFIGSPTKQGGPWERHTLDYFAGFAFRRGAGMRPAGMTREAEAAADRKRAHRAFLVLQGLGWAHLSKQVCPPPTQSGGQLSYRAEPAVRRLNIDLLARLTGNTWLLARDRAALDRRKGRAAPAPTRAANGDDLEIPFESSRSSTARTVAPAQQVDAVPFTPASPAVARAALASIRKLFEPPA